MSMSAARRWSMTMPRSSVWNRHCWAWVVFSGWASISCKDDLNEIGFFVKLRLHLFSTFAENVFWPVIGDKKLILYEMRPKFSYQINNGLRFGWCRQWECIYDQDSHEVHHVSLGRMVGQAVVLGPDQRRRWTVGFRCCRWGFIWKLLKCKLSLQGLIRREQFMLSLTWCFSLSEKHIVVAMTETSLNRKYWMCYVNTYKP